MLLHIHIVPRITYSHDFFDTHRHVRQYMISVMDYSNNEVAFC